MKVYIYLLVGFLTIPSFLFSQQLKWVKSAPGYIDLVDKFQNVYIADQPYGIQDIDPGPGVVNMNVNVDYSYFAKYDALFNFQWVKTSADRGFQYSIITNNKENELFVLVHGTVNNANNSTDYYITKQLSDGTLIYKKKAFYLETGYGGYHTDMLDLFTDSASNIWISGLISGKVSFGPAGTIETIPVAMPFIAKFNKDGDFLQVIKRKPDSYFASNYRRTKYKIDTTGTIHQIVFENNGYYYLKSDTAGATTKIKIVDTQNGNAEITHLILTDSDSILVAGTFTDAFDFDNSPQNKFLNPKGAQDVFIAKYTKTGKLIDVWQMGGNGRISITDNFILKNNYLVLGLLSEVSSVIDFDLGAGIFNVPISHSVIYACYDMSVAVKNDSIIPSELNNDLVADINDGPKGSYPTYFVNFRDTLFFVANGGLSGYELWKSDGTQKGTTLIKDLTTDGSSFNPTSSSRTSYPIVTNNNYLFVIPDTLKNSNTLWKTQGNISTFTQVPDQLVTTKFVLKNSLYAPKGTNSYLVTDGTTEGTKIRTYNINNSQLDFRYIVFEDSVIYITSRNGEMSEIVKFNGDVFSKIAILNKPTYGLEKFNGRFYFYELNTLANLVPKRFSSVKEDGSDYRVIADLSDNTTRTDESFFFIKSTNSTLLFLGYDAVNDHELWTTDGSTQNTHIVKDLNTAGGLNINNLILSGNGIAFFTADGGSGNDIFQTDGTAEGTIRLRGLNPFGKANYNAMAIVNSILYFGATNDNTGSELWKYKFIKDIAIEEGTRSYLSDSLSFVSKLVASIFPVDATDTSLTFELTESSQYETSIDSLGNLSVTPKPHLKSASMNDTIRILIRTNDGSKKSFEYKLVTGKNDNVSAIVANDINRFLIWPNPAFNTINIECESDFEGSIIVTDILGRSLLKQTLNGRMFQLDLGSLPKGVLFLKIQSKNKSKTFKFLHQ